MDARDETLGDVLDMHRRNLIPTYQRDYEWNEEGVGFSEAMDSLRNQPTSPC